MKRPTRRRVIELSVATAAITLLSFAWFFFWFDTWFAASHTLGAIQALRDSAHRMEAKGDHQEAETLLRAAYSIQHRRIARDPFGVDDQLELVLRNDLAKAMTRAGHARDREALERTGTLQ